MLLVFAAGCASSGAPRDSRTTPASLAAVRPRTSVSDRSWVDLGPPGGSVQDPVGEQDPEGKQDPGGEQEPETETEGAPDKQEPEAEAGEAEGVPAEQDEGEVASPEPEIDWVNGRLSVRYVGRWTGADEDHKLYGTLDADIGDPRHHDITGHFMGRVVGNFERGEQQFEGLVDTYDGDVVGHLYDAYIDFHSVSGFSRIRAGRQSLYDTPEVAFFDGVHAETEPIGDLELRLGAYGGASARLYESSVAGDWMAGGYAEGRPWEGGRLRVDYMHMEDDGLLGLNQNDLWGFGYWQTVARVWQLELEHTLLEGRGRDVRSRLAYFDTDSDLLLQVSYYQLLSTLNNLVNELDPYYNALQELFPYYQFGALASKGIADSVTVEGGADLRRVEDDADIGQFNRDYERYFVNLRFHDIGIEGFSASVLSDLWYADGRDVRTWGADLSQVLSDPLTASVGTYYSLYKYDLFTNSERDNVRTYYVRLEHETTESLTFDLAYELEDNDFDVFHTVRLRGVWRF